MKIELYYCKEIIIKPNIKLQFNVNKKAAKWQPFSNLVLLSKGSTKMKRQSRLQDQNSLKCTMRFMILKRLKKHECYTPQKLYYFHTSIRMLAY